MPTLDVSEVLTDPMLAEKVTVIRRVQAISDKGRTVVTPTEHKNVVAVVTAAHPNDLERLDDNQRTGRHLSVITKFALRATSPGYQPDIVVWRGDSYLVKALDPYPQYGAGFVQAIVGSLDSQDRPVPGLGAEQFNDPGNAPLAGAR